MSKGVEAQTRKLFKVCAMRHIPIFTFINKMDRDANDTFELLDDIEKELGIPTIVSMNPIMSDGTGMCGGCRLTVGGETKFACVDGPDFDGHLVDFDEAMHRGTMYKEFETHARDEYCNLLKKGEN